MGLETHNVDRWTDDRKEWREKMNRMTEIDKWEDATTDSHKGARIAGPKDRKNVASKTSLKCNWEGCDKQCKALAGLKAHLRSIHSKKRDTQRTLLPEKAPALQYGEA